MKKNKRKIIAILFVLLNITVVSSQCWKQVSAGNNFTLAIKSDGTLWAWGRAQGSYGNNQSPIQIGTDTDWKIAEAAADYSLIIKNNGTLWGWGNTKPYLPSQAQQVSTSTNWDKVICGS